MEIKHAKGSDIGKFEVLRTIKEVIKNIPPIKLIRGLKLKLFFK